MIKQLIAILLIAFAFSNCKTNSPNKVQGIPENAFWAGGIDGGNWFIIDSINSLTKTIRCKIYNDNSGELIVDKKFDLHCYLNESKINWGNLQEEFYGYDGECLHLITKDANNKSCWFK